MSDGPFAGYADLPAHLANVPVAAFPGDEPRARLAEILGLRVPATAAAAGVSVDREWMLDGVAGREVSWHTGFGPRTRAYLLTPADHDGNLPGLLGLHCHGGVRSTGAEQLVVTDRAAHPSAQRLRGQYYDGRALANDLARDGFAVLVHDTFSWGSRAFDLSQPTPKLAALAEALDARWREQGDAPTDDERFDAVSSLHEDHLAKGLGVLGASLAGMVAADDLTALDVLAGLSEVDANSLGVFGLSGGGGRAILAAALDPRVKATVVSCMMSTGSALVPEYLDAHSWLLHSPGLAAWRDLPRLAAMTAGDVLVQYGRTDPLFPREGMTEAHARLSAGLDARYTGAFFDAGHEWTAQMQDAARAWLAAHAASTPRS
ncbi:acetylxylan esterase [Microbacterium sp. C7(2022)]|uniref:acetylxylan esterase n=1 Tax=Microbacterium sp. C7(2022) TaxID=2992759 RepID=UPI00237AE150|nr:acetylxylan esterase [Microbacterium sp. C7(2022)]MDE0546641.1 acetylxylan esterase [Microbacterium sp. C7(2022)]